MDLNDRPDGCLQVVTLGLWGVEDLNGMRSARDGEQGAAVEVHLKLSGIQRGAHDNNLRQGEQKVILGSSVTCFFTRLELLKKILKLKVRKTQTFTNFTVIKTHNFRSCNA